MPIQSQGIITKDNVSIECPRWPTTELEQHDALVLLDDACRECGDDQRRDDEHHDDHINGDHGLTFLAAVERATFVSRAGRSGPGTREPLSCEHEQLDFDVGSDVMVGDERKYVAA